MRNDQWSQAFLFLSGSLRSGLSLEQALDVFVSESPQFFGCQQPKQWLPLEKRIQFLFPGKNLALARATLEFAYRAGGKAAPMLERCADMLQRKHEMDQRVQALTTQTRISAWIVGLTPAALLCGFGIISPAYVSLLFRTRLGMTVLAAAIILDVVGFVLVKRLARVSW